jgi:glycosyltransferase involved in cell wall biosynthesis
MSAEPSSSPEPSPLRVALFGAGARGLQCLAALRGDRRLRVVAFFDNDPGKWDTTRHGLPVHQPTAEHCSAVDAIILASQYGSEILAQLTRLGFADKAVFGPSHLKRRLDGGASADEASGPIASSREDLLGRAPAAIRALAARLDVDPPAVAPDPIAAAQEVACTICCNNYLAHATVLARSFLRHHPAGRFVIALADRVHPDVAYPRDPRISVIETATLGIPAFDTVAFKYDVLEFNTAVKPYLLETLLRRHGVERLLFLDPDILVLSPLHELFDALGRTPLLLTPHIRAPYADDHHPREIDILRAGTFNLGFVGVAAHHQTWDLLAWWQARLYDGCTRAIDAGYFVDQKWMDLAPSLFPDHLVIRDGGCNAAYWNLHDRVIERRDDVYLADGAPLRFFHFSGVDVDDLESVSKHQTRWTLPAAGALRDLFELYRVLLVHHGHAAVRGIAYAYGRFDNGVRIPDIVRVIYRDARLATVHARPFAVGEGSYFDWLRAPWRSGSLMSNLFASLRARPADAGAPGRPGVANEVDGLLQAHVDAERYHLPAELVDIAPAPAINAAPAPAGGRPLRRGRSGGAADAVVRGPSPHRRGGSRPGVNIVGYLQSETGVGEAARSLVRAFRAAGHPVACTTVRSHDDARQRDRSIGPLTGAAVHDLSVVCVNASEVESVQRELGPAFFAGRRNIGVWFWELEQFAAPPPALAAFDEIWTGSTFAQRAVAGVARVPVLTMRLPVAPPPPIPEARRLLGLPQDRWIVLFAFDALSVVARKNPLAVVRAFEAAFGRRSRRAHLVIKASRLELAPEHHEALKAAVAQVGGRLIDRYLDRREVSALFHACDTYVSLHRSEGFGLTMAEAMAIGKPVVATAYSGNLDFMTPANSRLVRWTPARVGPDAAPYPADATWAEPDVDDAARHLTALADAPELAATLGRRAAADLAASHGLAAVGRTLSGRLAVIPRPASRSLLCLP